MRDTLTPVDNGAASIASDALSTYGSWSSIFGLIVSLAGVVISVLAMQAAKSAEREASRAKEAAEGARNALRRYDAAADLRDAAAFMSEAIRLASTTRNWSLLADRCHAARTSVIRARSGHPEMSDRLKRTCQSAISWLRDAEALLWKWSTHDAEVEAGEIDRVTEGVLRYQAEIEDVSAELRNTSPAKALEV